VIPNRAWTALPRAGRATAAWSSQPDDSEWGGDAPAQQEQQCVR
jgi:hypothetical protein